MSDINGAKTVKEKAILAQLAATGLQAMHYYDHGISVTLLLGNKSDYLDGKWVVSKEVLARGIAICSITDQFSRKEGRLISLGRALKAYREQRSSKEVILRWANEESCNPLAGAILMFGSVYETVYKSCWMPELTEKEQALLTKRQGTK